ncbi:origin recognition complex subunit 5 [Lichtheimia corymbifera JMRC:FSU:9682]|uniref:Origin recognition complex subunit 5 n=1 Tax=Lichtheimia corymbifera JMRC:FSU:9682 TaxID=1263082 RepID=A0A068RPH2_9FUNG|nr:origin recognition complex subunit 5 [Lichtheimia corymbifera JMRC:FSU:9682]
MVLQELEAQFPGRSKQIATLLQLMGEPSDAVLPSIFIYGHPSSGKTSVVRAILEKTLARSMWAFINCIECHTPRMLFEHTINQWCDWTPSYENKYTGVRRIDNIHQFVKAIQEGVALDDERTVQFGDSETRYLVLDRAERLRDMGSTLIYSLLRLAEMTGRNICVIMISTVVFDKFRVRGGAYEPLVMRFSEYTKQDTVEILRKGYTTRLIQVEGGDPVELNDEFVDGFSEIIYNIFNHNCKDINELRYLAALLFPIYIKPLKDGDSKVSERSRLYQLALPFFAKATDKLYLREVSSAEWAKETKRLDELDDAEAEDLFRKQSRDKGYFALPYYTKFLLIAAFLASYNPPRYDVRYFAKAGEARKRKKGGGTRKAKVDNLGGKMRPQLLGPKSFPVERMLAIFYSIIDDTLEDSIDIQTQITSLTTLRLLVRSNNLERLDGSRFKCNVSFQFIKAVASSLSPSEHSGLTYQYDSDNYDTGIQRSRVYEDYIEYLRVNEPDQQPLNAAGFGKLVKTVFPGIRTRRLGTRGQSRYNYCGIAYKQPRSSSPPQQQRRQSKSPSPSTTMMEDDTNMPMIQQQAVIVNNTGLSPSQHIGFPSNGHSEQHQLPQSDIQERDIPTLQLFTAPSTTDPSRKPEAEQLASLYHNHCQEILKLMLLNQDISDCIQRFYSTIPEPIRQIMNGDSKVMETIWRWDCVLYDTIIHVLFPSIHAPISKATHEYLKSCSSNVSSYYTMALTGYSESLTSKKMAVMYIFISKLDRLVISNQLAQAADHDLTTQAKDMLVDWEKISIDNILDGAQWMSPWGGDQGLGQQLNKVKLLLQRQCQDQIGIGAWVNWVYDIVHQHLITPHDTISWVKEAIQRWTLYSSLILRELALVEDATTLDAFRKLWMFINDYVIYLGEESIASRNMAAMNSAKTEMQLPRTFSSSDSYPSSSLS